MHTKITVDGKLVIRPYDETEEFALRHWYDLLSGDAEKIQVQGFMQTDGTYDVIIFK